MTEKRKQVIKVIIIAAVAFVLGRLAFRFGLNLLLGGTMFGGDFL